MSRSRLVFLLTSGTLVLFLVSGTLFGATAGASEKDDSLYKYLSVFTEVFRLVRQAYVDETDPGSLMDGALDGAPDALDPFSMYVPPEALTAYLAAREVGVRRSGMRVVKERGVAYVVGVQEGGPADEAGLVRGDVLTEIDGDSTRSMPLWQIERSLAGPSGSRVALKVLRGGDSREVPLSLHDFDPVAVALDEVQGLPLLRVADFRSDMRDRLGELLAGIDSTSLLVDIRGVAWGEEEAAYTLGELFATGQLGSLVNRDGALTTYTSQQEPDWSGRMVVLIDRGCLGACEIFAKILRERADAKLVGQSTFGFAGRSRLVDLHAGGSLVITEAFYTGPDGEALDHGVEPDLAVGDRSRGFRELEESLEDLTLDRAIELLRSPEPSRKAA